MMTNFTRAVLAAALLVTGLAAHGQAPTKTYIVQLADAPRMTMDVLGWSRHFRNFPGQGDLDVTGFTRAVLASGYAGPLSLEVFNDGFRAAPARLNARDGLRSLILVEAEAGGRALPPAPALDGIEFMEFAVDDAAGAELAGLLGSLGFRHAGRQHGPERRAGQRCRRALPAARAIGLRHGAAGR